MTRLQQHAASKANWKQRISDDLDETYNHADEVGKLKIEATLAVILATIGELG